MCLFQFVLYQTSWAPAQVAKRLNINQRNDPLKPFCHWCSMAIGRISIAMDNYFYYLNSLKHHHNHHVKIERCNEDYADQSSQSPIRESREPSHFLDYEPNEADVILKLKWMDNSPRMSRLREHRQKRLMNRLEVNLNGVFLSWVSSNLFFYFF